MMNTTTLRIRLLALMVAALTGGTAWAQHDAPQRAANANLQLYGSVVGTWYEYSSWYQGNGIYTFNTSSSTTTNLVKKDVVTYGGGTYAQGVYYSTNYSEDESSTKITFPIRLYEYNTADWSQKGVALGFTFTSISCDMTFDPETQQLFGIFSDADYTGKYRTFGRVKKTDDATYGTLFDCDSIGQLPERMVALTANKDGQIYGFGLSGKLYTIDKWTAEATLVGNTGVSTQGVFQSATCDYATGKLYWFTVYDDWFNDGVYEVDPATAKATLVTDFGYDNSGGNCEWMTGLYVKQDLDLAVRPAAVSDLAVAFTSLTSGKATFTMPTKDVDGGSLTTQLDYVVRVDGKPVATGKAAAGAAVSADLNFAAEGEATVSVTTAVPATTTRPAAVSEQATVTAWAGHDVPLPPTDLTVVAGASDITLAWTAPTAGVHGGYVDAENLTYNVSRFADDDTQAFVVVASGLKATTFTDHITSTAKKGYYYKVTAVNGTFESTAVQSTVIELGSTLSLPYSNSFNDESSLDGFTIVDANGDGSTWKYNDSYGMAAYAYNSSNSADDWLITPAICVTKGAIYEFSFDAYCTYPDERVAAAVGLSPTAEAMTTTVVEPTTITYSGGKHALSGSFRATENAVIYFGIHAVSDADQSTLYVDNLKINEIGLTAPDVVSDFQATPAAKGANQATITFTAPTQTLGGEALTGNLTVKLTRDGKSLTTLTGIAPGATGSYTDTYVSSAWHTYAATVTSAAGVEGAAKGQRVFVGTDAPGAVRNLRAVEDLDHEGLIHVTWDAPTEGQSGGYLNPDDLTYYVSVGSESTDRSAGSNTSLDDQLTINGKQTYQAYSVYAVNSTGSGRSVWQTCTAIAGPATKAPVVESFPSNTMKAGPWLTKMINGAIGEAYCYCMSQYGSVTPQDADGGMLSFSATQLGKSARNESPKIDISGLQHPVANFWVFFNGEGDSLTVAVSKDYGTFDRVLPISTADQSQGWHRYSIDLSAYKDSRFIQLGFEGKAIHTLENFVAFDNIAVVENVEHDLLARTLTAPEKVNAGERGVFDLTLRNNTGNYVKGSAYSVVLYQNGKAVATAPGCDLDADYVETITLTHVPSVLDPVNSTYRAVIAYGADEVADNNASSDVAVQIVLPTYPAPTALKALSQTEGASLTWQVPDLINRPAQATTDGFDTYEAFAISGYGDWTVADNDGQNTIKLTLSSLGTTLNYAHAGEPMAFQVFNVEESGIPFSSWDAHSGQQFLASFSCASTDGGATRAQNDDWLISPELDGSAQTISLYAKAGQSGSYVPEQMEFLYSTTDTQTTSFTKIGQTVDVTNVSGWQEYSFSVPEGAKHFAVRCVSSGKLALLIDDVTYIPAGATPEALTLTAYNVYRDSTLLTTVAATATSYVDGTALQGQNHTYHVTAVYDKGESAASNAAYVGEGASIGSTTQSSLTVAAGRGFIAVSGAQGQSVSVCTAGGSIVAKLSGSHRYTVPVAPGIYLVSAAGRTVKVVVK